MHKNDIEYRREILEDLKRNPNTEPSLRAWAEEFAELIKTHKMLRKDARRSGTTDRDAVAAANNVRITQAICLKRGILFLRDALTRLCGDYNSEGLKRLKEALETIATAPESEDLLYLCGQIENTLLNETSYRLTLTEEGAVARCEPIYPQRTPPKEEKRRFSLFRREVAPAPYRGTSFLSAELIGNAVKESSGLLEQLCEELFSRFGEIGKELSFYRTALEYETCMTEKGATLIYPKIASYTSLTDLCDPFLLLSQSAKKVVKNDYIPKKAKGTLIFGKNSGDKTVFLRSVMTAQLLAQGGLPISAKGVIHPYARMDSIFAEAETDSKTDRAGRFEQEVRQTAKILEKTTKDTILFFNEPFQTTDPREGAVGLAGILRHLSENGVHWITVTHLKDLKTAFWGRCLILTAQDGYRIMPTPSQELD